ncbi:MAG: peptide-methionine (S)-S-oxide reductase MsrA [Acidobacteriota bacterium]|nr:MAG: peptide-methionine (S)-S-oxide reductase MsrA [Acidobacteriota bacterium]
MAVNSPEIATLGGGCFWCLEAVFERVQGVGRVESGYSGGSVPDPSYKQVCSGETGHAEVVQVHFDPDSLSFRQVLEIFFAMHDPTTRNRQGADVGTQYRSVILFHSEEQRRTAMKMLEELEREQVFRDPIVTEIATFEKFYPAEPEHQDYYARNPQQGYCQAVISPKVSKLRKTFTDKLKPEFR